MHCLGQFVAIHVTCCHDNKVCCQSTVSLLQENVDSNGKKWYSCLAKRRHCFANHRNMLQKLLSKWWLKFLIFLLLCLEKIFLKHILYLAFWLQTCLRFFTLRKRVNAGICILLSCVLDFTCCNAWHARHQCIDEWSAFHRNRELTCRCTSNYSSTAEIKSEGGPWIER